MDHAESGEGTMDVDDLANVPPLLAAVWRGRDGMITTLLYAGADPDLAVDRALTPMHVAAARNNIGAVRQLLEAGANPQPELRSGIRSPVEVAEELGHDRVIEVLDAATS